MSWLPRPQGLWQLTGKEAPSPNRTSAALEEPPHLGLWDFDMFRNESERRKFPCLPSPPLSESLEQAITAVVGNEEYKYLFLLSVTAKQQII